MVEGARGRTTNKGVVATLPGIADRVAAEALAGAEVWVDRAQLPPPAPGEYYWVDLEGMTVVNLEGVVLGTVSHLLNTGANDILSVAGERERLVPFIDGDFVKSVDFGQRRITVDWDADF
jgi:16S rRNA processing protein RimM